ncbi:mechanosensitive ion channel family protein [Pseudoflavitalea sp. G-6-1-2]|uniref:mechanosensitive ion channel family protein n=1 Tax=Pseudoflavitalea sp. G-6-1-2 TaxID=2728841 RepID=UPI00146A4A4E|nr:mechanosensitive ion channel family protein [Pseudoflavitalea sp. G-6-1-2]NML20041.1 mechanosensitive ion channel family protein [Pseudoflavitalea sp. G-6-1-2]
MDSFWKYQFWGNSILSYTIAAGSILLAWIIIRLIRGKLLKKILQWTSKTESRYDDIALSSIQKFVLPWIYIFVNYQILQQLTWTPKWERVLHVAMAVVSMYFFIRIVNHVLSLMLSGIMRKRNESEHRMKQMRGALLVLKVIVWVLGIIFLIDNLGYNVTTMIAGLGVGGIAIALAAQTILGDLFGYFVIFFDKPFEIGDYVVMGDKSGNIEYIGIKTTRIRSLSGEQLVITNSDLTKQSLANFKSLQQRREVMKLGITYDTPVEMLREVPAMVKQIVESKPKTKFDRAHMSALADSSINFEIVYLIQTNDYSEYMDVRQAVLLDILSRFKESKINFAYPTQTLYYKTTAVV